MFKIAKGYEHVTKTIRIPIPLADKLEQLAADNYISFNQLINQCLNFAIENQQEEDDEDDEESTETTE
ncbi:MAG: hypothetical protein NC340_09690 [Ruminococcus flavefaciens]|nr:hypothetical protein [Ruminococcus flavefaciens]MCM1230587.1 hypothetical protein [Ruminococcus flavefaciens]